MKTKIKRKSAQKILLVNENQWILKQMKYERKVPFSDITTKVNFNKLGWEKRNAILTLTMVKTDKESFANIFPEDYVGYDKVYDNNECCYLVKTQGKIFLVNNEGFTDSRYALELTNLDMDLYNSAQSLLKKLEY